MTGFLLLQTLWLALPVIVGGLLHVAAIKIDVLSPLARIPVDGGLTCRGRRLFGDNKSVRGVILMIAATTVCAIVQLLLESHVEWAGALSLPGAGRLGPVRWGLLLGTGYVVGELPNSFIRRQLDVAPGGTARGWLGPMFWVIDQVDSLIGVLVLMRVAWVPPLDVVVLLFVIALTVLRAAWHGHRLTFLWLAAFCMGSDIIDGKIARGLGQTSDIGARLDRHTIAPYARVSG